MMKLKFTYRFEAAHRFTKSSSAKCMTPHGHTWRATVVFQSKLHTLNQNQMVEEFTLLKTKWRKFIMETVDHSFFHHYADPILSTLKEHIPSFRGLPFPGDPTTELIAGLFLEKARTFLSDVYKDIEAPVFISEVSIQETPTNTFDLKLLENEDFSKYFTDFNKFTGWWKNQDISSRLIEKI